MGLPFFKRLLISAATVAAVTVEFVFSFFEFGLLLASFFYAWSMVLGLGVGLIVLRFAFFALVPFMLEFAVPIVDIINIILVLLTLMEDAVITLVDVVIEVMDAVSALFGDPMDVKTIDYKGFTTITYAEFEDELKLIATECHPIDSTAAIVDQWLPELIDEEFCPVYRSLWPLPYDIGPSLYNTFGAWVSDPTPWEGNNCDRVVETKHGVLCGSIAVGYPILEVLFPSVIVGIFILSSGSQLAAIIRFAVDTTVEIVFGLATSVLHVIEEIDKVVQRACAVASAIGHKQT